MAERLWRVSATDCFLARLESIEAFWQEAGADQAFASLLDDLRGTVIRNLRRFPRMGRRFLDRQPISAEALSRLADLPPGAAESLREYLSGDYLLLYSLDERLRVVHLLSIRHHRQLSYQFGR